MAQIALILGASIFGFLGSLHLFFTFFGNKFDPYEHTLKLRLKDSTLVISKNANFWNAWIGFNASHSLGAILVAAIYIPMAVKYELILMTSVWFSILPTLIGFSYLSLAKRYWFSTPTIGIFIATLCFCFAGYSYNAA